MYLQGKYLQDVTEQDLESLLINQVRESKTLEYKRNFNLTDDKDKNRQEFLFDVTAFYNTDGRCLVYGIEEKKDDQGKNTGYPEQFISVGIPNSDQTDQQIQSLIRNNTDPVLSSVQTKFFTVQGCKILVVGIPKNFGLPCMVILNDLNRFYRRNNSGKYAVETQELSGLFLQNQSLRERAEQFRSRRIESVTQASIIPNLDLSTPFFVHLVPFSTIDDIAIDVTNLRRSQFLPFVTPITSTLENRSGWDFQYNIDGLMSYSTERVTNKSIGYNQYFRKILPMLQRRNLHCGPMRTMCRPGRAHSTPTTAKADIRFTSGSCCIKEVRNGIKFSQSKWRVDIKHYHILYHNRSSKQTATTFYC